MTNISTKYMGLELKSPVIVASSGMTDSVEKIIKAEKAGAGAVVLKSLFEEQIMMDVDAERVNNMYGTYANEEAYALYYTRKNQVESYLKLIREAKKAVDIPVIASINCVSDGEWSLFAKKMEEAGADGLELNMFILPSDPETDAATIEKTYTDIISHILSELRIPVAVKIGHYFTDFAGFAQRLSRTGIKGMVLFNRFYSPDVDVEQEKIISTHIYSNADENAMTLRWTGILSPILDCGISATTGIHDGNSLIKNILVGAESVQIASAIYQSGFEVITEMNQRLESWMAEKGYENLEDFKGKLSMQQIAKPMLYERSQFMRYFSDAGRR